MRIYAVELDFATLGDDLFERALGSPLLDIDSRTRIRRFFRREDAWRCLIGRLLPFYALAQHGVAPSTVTVARTSSGKPFFSAGVENVKFNVSHDSNLVVMAWQDGAGVGDEVGVDVMRCLLPQGETLRSFVRVLAEQLTSLEKHALLAPRTPSSALDGITHLFHLWTLKEAYTKTLGLGLGFNFARIEYDVSTARVRIDSDTELLGWHFIETNLEVKGHRCVVVAARRSKEETSGAEVERADAAQVVTLLDPVVLLEDLLVEKK